MTMTDVLALLGDQSTLARQPALTIERAADPATLREYRELRRRIFVGEQALFERDDTDGTDDDPRAITLAARLRDGTLAGGVRLAPADPARPDIGWWRGSRLAVTPEYRRFSLTNGGDSIGPALIRAACGCAADAGALRFEATVQSASERMFRRLGWRAVRPVTVAGAASGIGHVLMRWPIDRIAAHAASAKAALGPLLRGLYGPDGPAAAPGFAGDDGVPVPGSDLVAACDAIIPSMVERDPEWAGWCSVLVNVNDLAAMGAAPVGLLDALAARDASFAARILSGLRRASAAYGVPVLGGHTQLGVPAALSVTALGRPGPAQGRPIPVPGGGGRPGHQIRVTADLGGGWRPGYTGRQWDSTTHRSPGQLRAMLGWVAAARPAAAKDVSMAGLAGTLGMMAEASGCGAVLDVERIPRPAGATAGDWLTCFPGFAMITADGSATTGRGTAVPPPGPAASAVCGELTSGAGLRLRWPDGEETRAIDAAVTGLGRAMTDG